MKINRVFARASHKTFTIKPIKELLERYKVGNGWIDPYAGNSNLAEFTNDLNPNTTAQDHLDALDFVNKYKNLTFNGALFDPPYSYRQVKDHYEMVGHKPTSKDTSYNFYGRVIRPLSKTIKTGGYAISFGWNSNGFGKVNGFEIIEVLLVAHGLHHNDTIVTVEQKRRPD